MGWNLHWQSEKRKHLLTLCIQIDFPIKIEKDCPLDLLRGHKSEFPNCDAFMSLTMVCTLTDGADSDEMHFAAFHPGLRCLQNVFLALFSFNSVTDIERTLH